MDLLKKINHLWENSYYIMKKNAAILTVAGLTTFGALTANQVAAQTPTEVRKVQRDFFQLPPSKQAEIIYDWYINAVDDSLSMVVFGNDRLYATSGGTLLTSPRSGIDVITTYNGKPHVAIEQVGKSGARFKNQSNLDLITSWPDIGNLYKLSDSQLKDAIHLSTGIIKDHFSVVRDEDGIIVHTPYTGPSFKNVGGNEYVTTRTDVDGNKLSHILFPQGTVGYLPAESVFEKEFKLSLVNELRSQGLPSVEYAKALQELFDESQEEVKDLRDQNQSLLDEKEESVKKTASLQTKNTHLNDFLNNFEIGPAIYISNKGELAYGLSVGLPVGENNRKIFLGTVFQPGMLKKEDLPGSIEYSEKSLTNFPGIVAVATDTVSGSESSQAVNSSYLLGFEVLKNLSIIGGVNVQRNISEKSTTYSSHTFNKGFDGIPFNHDARIEHHNVMNVERGVNPVVGASYNVGPVRITGLYTHSSNKEDRFIQLGAGFDLAEITRKAFFKGKKFENTFEEDNKRNQEKMNGNNGNNGNGANYNN